MSEQTNIPPPPVATPPARTLAEDVVRSIEDLMHHLSTGGGAGTDGRRHKLCRSLERLAGQQPAPVAADGAWRGEQRWGIIACDGNLLSFAFRGRNSAEDQCRILGKWLQPTRVVQLGVTVLADDGAPAGAEGAVEMTINTRDERGVKQPLDPGTAMALGKAAKAIHDRYTIDQLTARLAAAESRALDATTGDANLWLEAEAMRAERDEWERKAREVGAAYADLLLSHPGLLEWAAKSGGTKAEAIAERIMLDFKGGLAPRVSGQVLESLGDRIERELRAVMIPQEVADAAAKHVAARAALGGGTPA